MFGSITMCAGITGLMLGCYLSQWLRKCCKSADPIICGVGLIISAPLLLATTYAATSNSALCFALLFLGQVALNMNWAIVSDILLVRIKTKRNYSFGNYLLLGSNVGATVASVKVIFLTFVSGIKLVLSYNQSEVTLCKVPNSCNT